MRTLDFDSKKFLGKYRNESSRLQGFDYGSDGAYFVTICTKNREHFFGEIRNGIMGLNDLGLFLYQCWYLIPDHFPFVVLDEFVVMPDHAHGILFIDKTNCPTAGTPKLGVPAGNPYWKPGNLGVIINQYKRACTLLAREIDPDFAWQPRFHDRIVRNEGELNRIRRYIRDNPRNWNQDKNNFDW